MQIIQWQMLGNVAHYYNFRAIDVYEKIYEERLFIPDVITVNDDTNNDMFTVYSIYEHESIVYRGSKPFSMFIYNRWGEQIFYSEKPVEGCKGREHASGVYLYHINLGDERFKGSVSVMK